MPCMILLQTIEEQEQARCTIELLHKFLDGGPIDAMIQEEPSLLFEDVREGLVQVS